MNLRAAIGDVDTRLDKIVERARGNASLDRVFYSASALGDFSLVWHLVGVGRAAIRGTNPLPLSAALAVESVLVNWGVKSAFRRVRPADVEPGPLPLRQPLTSSFPSGHASAAFMAASILRAEGASRAWFGLAAVVAASRVYVRIHYPSDVVAGALLGLALGQPVGAVLRRRPKPARLRRRSAR